MTDDNSLLYICRRHYDTEIKRFINQDILTGSIGDSQSLNRYSYVQGNPVSFSDLFGLSPFERLRQAFRPLHAVLNIAGIIPGPVGMLASLAQVGLYGLEGNSALAAHYLSQSLMIGLAGPVGGHFLFCISGDFYIRLNGKRQRLCIRCCFFYA